MKVHTGKWLAQDLHRTVQNNSHFVDICIMKVHIGKWLAQDLHRTVQNNFHFVDVCIVQVHSSGWLVQHLHRTVWKGSHIQECDHRLHSRDVCRKVIVLCTTLCDVKTTWQFWCQGCHHIWTVLQREDVAENGHLFLPVNRYFPFMVIFSCYPQMEILHSWLLLSFSVFFSQK